MRGLGRASAAAISLAIVLVVVFLLYAGFTSSPSSKPPGAGPSRVHLIGSGSSLVYPQMSMWIRLFTQENPSVVIDYNPVGSGAGQTQFFQRVVDFAGSDPPLTRAQWSKYRGSVLQFPVILSAVAVVYNLPGVEELKLDAATLAKIYKGDIEYWDDPAIASLNPRVHLPHEKIIVVHRSDASGTTMVFTYFLHKAAPSLWGEDLVGKTVEWPVDKTGRGIGGKGNQGVVEQVLQNKYSIAYVELAYALKHGLKIASIENAEGVFLKPSRETIIAAAEKAYGSLPSSPEEDWSKALDSIVYAPGEKSYPITTFSFLIVWKKYDEPKARALSEFLEWIARKGYSHMVEGYVALPESLRQVVLEASHILLQRE